MDKKQYDKEWKLKHKNHIKNYNSEYWETNKEKIKKKRLERYEESKEYQRNYYKKHKKIA